MEKDGIVLGADTVVAIEGEILGKPADKKRSRENDLQDPGEES